MAHYSTVHGDEKRRPRSAPTVHTPKPHTQPSDTLRHPSDTPKPTQTDTLPSQQTASEISVKKAIHGAHTAKWKMKPRAAACRAAACAAATLHHHPADNYLAPQKTDAIAPKGACARPPPACANVAPVRGRGGGMWVITRAHAYAMAGRGRERALSSMSEQHPPGGG